MNCKTKIINNTGQSLIVGSKKCKHKQWEKITADFYRNTLWLRQEKRHAIFRKCF